MMGMGEFTLFRWMRYITKYKYICIILSYQTDISCQRKFKIYSHLLFRDDHEGLMIDIDLFNYNFCFEFCDSRHWDYENNRFYNPEKFDSAGNPKGDEK